MASLFKRILRKCTRPRRPCSEQDKAWIESQFLWLKSQLGLEPLHRPTLLPTREFFPIQWRGTEDESNTLIDTLCEYMKIGRDEINVTYFGTGMDEAFFDRFPMVEHRSKGAAGTYSPIPESREHEISISQDHFSRPVTLIATICHELGHVHLLGHGRISGDEPDHEPLTDILVVYFGAGIFTANSAYQFGQSSARWYTSRLGYLTEPQLGYALACYAWMRGETDPSWQNHLTSNIKNPYFDDSIYYMEKTGDTTLPFGG